MFIYLSKVDFIIDFNSIFLALTSIMIQIDQVISQFEELPLLEKKERKTVFNQYWIS